MSLDPRKKGTFYSYRVYGLGVQSALRFPELAPARGEPDVVIGFSQISSSAKSATEPFRPHVTSQGVHLAYPGAGVFLVRDGRCILIDPEPGVEERVLRLFLLGAGLGVILHQRGRLVLHASAVCVNGGAVAFLSDSGGGKSTLAAAMHRRGHSLVADDVLAVNASSESAPRAYPGFPQLKLWPEAAVALGEALETLPHLRPGLEKRARKVKSRFAQGPLPLKRLYVLSQAKENSIERLRLQEAMVELIRYSYCARLLQSIGKESHFRQCASVAERIGVRRLNALRSLRALPDLARMVEDDLARNS